MGRSVPFADFTDVQTRLILLPRVEEEGVGAVVASYYFVQQRSKVDGTSCTHDATTEAEQVGGDMPTPASVVPDDSLKGYLLTGMMMGESGDDEPSWKDLEFAEILSAIRKATPPLVLKFEAPETTEDETEESAEQSKPVPFEEEKKMEEGDLQIYCCR